MENYKFELIYNCSLKNLVGVREQRRGTLAPLKKKFIQDIAAFYSDQSYAKTLYGANFADPAQSWINYERNEINLPGCKKKTLFKICVPECYNNVRSIKFTTNEENVIVGYGSGNIEVLPLTGEGRKIKVKPNQNGFPITSIRPMSDSHKFIAASLFGVLYICRLDFGHYDVFAKEDDNEINSVDISPCRKNVITGGKDAGVRLYDIETGKIINRFKRDTNSFSNEDNCFHSLRIFCVKFHSKLPQIFLSGGWDGIVKIWDIRIPRGCVRNIKGPYMCGEAIDTDGTSVLTGSFQMKNGLQLWDLNSGKFVESVSPLNHSVAINGEFTNTVQFCVGDLSKNTIIRAGSNPNFEILDISDKKVIYRFPAAKSVLAIDSSSKYLAYGGYENFLKIVQC